MEKQPPPPAALPTVVRLASVTVYALVVLVTGCALFLAIPHPWVAACMALVNAWLVAMGVDAFVASAPRFSAPMPPDTRLLARLHRRLFPRLHRWSYHYRRTTEGESGFFEVRECRLCGRREIRHDPHPSWDEWQEESVARLTLFDDVRERYRRLYDTARREDA